MSGAEIEYGEFWLPGGSDAHPDNPLAYCHRCGAIILHTDVHTAWHAKLSSAAANPWPWRCESCGGDIVHNGETWRHVTGPGCDFLLVPEAAGIDVRLEPARAAAGVPTPGAVISSEELPAIPPKPLDLALVRDLIERANTEVGEVSAQGAHRRWRMSIPAQPGRDSDLIIGAAFAAAAKLADEVELLRAQRDAALALHEPDDEGCCRKCVQSWAHEETETSPCSTAKALGAGQ